MHKTFRYRLYPTRKQETLLNQQNVSHCFRTKEGAVLHFDIMSYIVTLRKNGANIFSGITSAMKGKPVIPFSRDD